MSRTGIIDTHAHLDDNRFDSDRDQLIEKLGLELDAVINQGCTLASSAASIALAEKYPFIYAAVGIHPKIWRLSRTTVIWTSWLHGPPTPRW